MYSGLLHFVIISSFIFALVYFRAFLFLISFPLVSNAPLFYGHPSKYIFVYVHTALHRSLP